MRNFEFFLSLMPYITSNYVRHFFFSHEKQKIRLFTIDYSKNFNLNKAELFDGSFLLGAQYDPPFMFQHEPI